MDLHEKIRSLPTQPGVYLYKNAEGEVIYVGKANNLRARVRSYFLEAAQANAKTGSLMREAVDIEYIQVANENEALALENNLIKQRQPRCSTSCCATTKTYPYHQAHPARPLYPKVFVTRRLKKDGSAYFGPYIPRQPRAPPRRSDRPPQLSESPAARSTISRYHPRACLQYHISRSAASAPAWKGLHPTPEEYSARPSATRSTLSRWPRRRSSKSLLHQRMAEASDTDQFELAARYRDQLVTIDQVKMTQRMENAGGDDADVFGFHFDQQMLAVNLLPYARRQDRRDLAATTSGRTCRSSSPKMPRLRSTSGCPRLDSSAAWECNTASIPPAFFSAFPQAALPLDQPYVPPTPSSCPWTSSPDRDLLSATPSPRKRRRRYEILVPQRGEKRSLVDLVVAELPGSPAVTSASSVLQPSQKAIREASLQDFALTLPDSDCPNASSASTSPTSRAPRPSPPWSSGRTVR